MATENSWDKTSPITEANGGTSQSTYAKGDILYASASNTLSKLTIGSDDQILSVATDIPAWVDGVPGDQIVLSSQTASASASIDFTSVMDDTLYSHYIVQMIAIKAATDTANFLCLWSVDDGSTWLGSTGYNWVREYAQTGSTSRTDNTADSSIQLGASLGTGTGEGFSGTLWYYPSAAPSTTYNMTSWQGVNLDSSAVFFQYSGSAINTTTSEVDALQFKMSTGNISSGTILLLGIIK